MVSPLIPPLPANVAFTGSLRNVKHHGHPLRYELITTNVAIKSGFYSKAVDAPIPLHLLILILADSYRIAADEI